MVRGLAVKTQQQYGENPLAVRETGQYQKEYVESFVDKWDALIDWERRAKSHSDSDPLAADRPRAGHRL